MWVHECVCECVYVCVSCRGECVWVHECVCVRVMNNGAIVNIVHFSVLTWLTVMGPFSEPLDLWRFHFIWASLIILST